MVEGSFTLINPDSNPQSVIALADLRRPLTLRARPNTDLWRKPPSIDEDNAPVLLTANPVALFHRARVTIKANWTRKYDQGGLVFFRQDPIWKRPWLKTGIEFFDGRPNFSTVTAQEASDWSLIPWGSNTLTVEIEREKVDEAAGTGSSLWVYLVDGEKRTPVREVTWAFHDIPVGGMVQVGVYVARPTSKGDSDGEPLEVSFDGLIVE